MTAAATEAQLRGAARALLAALDQSGLPLRRQRFAPLATAITSLRRAVRAPRRNGRAR